MEAHSSMQSDKYVKPCVYLSLSHRVVYYSSTFLFVRRECKTKSVSLYSKCTQIHADFCPVHNIYYMHLFHSHLTYASVASVVVSVWTWYNTIASLECVKCACTYKSNIPHQTKAIAVKKSIKVGLRLRSVHIKLRETKGMASSEGGRRLNTDSYWIIYKNTIKITDI